MGGLVGKETGPSTAGYIVPDQTSPLYGFGSGKGGRFSGLSALLAAALAALFGPSLTTDQQEQVLKDATSDLAEGECGAMNQGYLKEIRGDKNRHCYWGNADLTPGDFPGPPPPPPRQQRPAGGAGKGFGKGGYGGYGALGAAGGAYGGYGGYPPQGGGYGYGQGGYGGYGQGYGAPGQFPPGHGPGGYQGQGPYSGSAQGGMASGASGGDGWHGEPGARWKAGAPPQKRRGTNVLPENAITGPPEHVDKIEFPPQPSPRERSAGENAQFLYGASAAGAIVGAAGFLL